MDPMRRTKRIVVFAVSGALGFVAATVFGYAKIDAWNGFGDNFKLGYVVGYLDAVSLGKRHDARFSAVPSLQKYDYERWVAGVNEFYADPKHAKWPIADAMAVTGAKVQAEVMKAYRERAGLDVPASPSPSGTSIDTGRSAPAGTAPAPRPSSG